LSVTIKTIAITGIGGFIGFRLAERCAERGWKIRGIDLSPAAVERTRALGAEGVIGDINDPAALQRAFAGADVVIHTAAIVEEDGARELYEKVNVEGTRSVCKAAVTAGVRRLVQLSSIMVYGFDYPPDVTEDGPFVRDNNVYNLTKRESEQVAMSFDDPAQDFGVIVVRPGDVYGTNGAQWIRRPLEMIRKYQFALPDGGRGVINHVHVDNLIDGIFLALEKDARGEAFNLTDGVATSCVDFYRYHARMAGVAFVPRLPAGVLKRMLQITEWVLKPLGIKPPARAAAVQFLNRRNRISIDKAARQLGYVPRIGLEAGMRGIAAALAAEGQRICWPSQA
jgi:nucleoside-diphosphate-sugar epimerase